MRKNSAETPEAFVTVEQPEEPRRRGRRRSGGTHLSIVDGKLDTSTMSDEEQAELYATLAADDTLSATIKEMQTTAQPGLQMIQPKHVSGLLTIIEFAERLFIPKLIKAKTGLDIPPQIAKEAFKFPTDEAERSKITEPGAIALDQITPAFIKEWIVKTGPMGEFFGALTSAMYSQTEQAILLTVASKQQPGEMKQ